MKDFKYYTPTEVIFGEKSEEKVARLVKKHGGTKVLVHYGGQSAIKSGLLDKVCGLLSEEGIEFFKLGGVVPNPRLSKVYEGIDLCREEGIDFIQGDTHAFILRIPEASGSNQRKSHTFATLFKGQLQALPVAGTKKLFFPAFPIYVQGTDCMNDIFGRQLKSRCDSRLAFFQSANFTSLGQQFFRSCCLVNGTIRAF